MRHATRPNSRITALLAAPLVLALGCSDDGWTPNGNGTGTGGTDGNDDQPSGDDLEPGLDDGGEDAAAASTSVDCVAHQLRAFAYPIYANEDGTEVVSPGEQAHPLVCVGTGDASTHGYFAEVTICGPRVTALGSMAGDVEVGASMIADAVSQCEAQLMDSFEAYWPDLKLEYEHGTEAAGVDLFALSRVACIPAHAEADPYMDHTTGWCPGYDDTTVADLEPLWDEQDDDWDYCSSDAGECHVLNPTDVTADASACETYLEQVAMDIVLEIDGDRHKATIDAALVESLLSLEVAHCEKNPYDGEMFREIAGESIFAAVGFRQGDAPRSVQALEFGVPVGSKFVLGEEQGQEIAAFAGLFAVTGEAPTELRVTFDRDGTEMALDLAVQ